MEQTKQKLAELINTINQLFPEDNDLKGFLGISKALITDTLIQSETQLVALKEFDNHFETIILKRELAELFDKINRELAEGFDKIKPNQFNTILKLIFKIKFLIRETYISVVSSGSIRTEAEIVKAKEELNLLSSNIEQLKKINVDLILLKDATIETINSWEEEVKVKKETTVGSISSFEGEVSTVKESALKEINEIHERAKQLKESAESIVADFEIKQRTATENEQKIGEFLTTVESHNKTVQEIADNTAQWKQDIIKSKEDFAANATEFSSLNLKFKTVQTEIEETQEKIFGKKDKDGNVIAGYLQETEDLKNKIAAFLTEQQTKFSTQFKEIEGLLPGATSTGLAKAYQDQKLSYEKPIRNLSYIFIITMGVMTLLSLYILYDQFINSREQTLTQALISLLKDLPFYVPTIWLAAYASKQRSQYKRLQQEYAFKETNAKSFHGHKIQIEQLMKDGATDKDLLSQLVAQLVMITSQNPSETLDSKGHNDGPPLFKFLEKALPTSKKEKG